MQSPNYPFLVLSDIHMNDWSAYSHVLPNKINSRLQDTIEAVYEAANALDEQGGKDIVITGDLFHTRGKIKPTVFNPVFDMIEALASHFNIWMLPGNHDLEGKDSDTIGNAFACFRALSGVKVFNQVTEVGDFVFLPWIELKDDFVQTINKIENPSSKVVFCHIGIDGVLNGVAGKVGKAVLDRGFKYVFSGDYHNHKALGNGIYSVGALTHHNFGDLGATAGYLLVYPDRVEQRATSAPQFTYGGDKRTCQGNIIRLTGVMTEEEAAKTVKAHYDYGAIHVQDLTTRPVEDSKENILLKNTGVKVDLTLDHALETFTKHRFGSQYKEIYERAKALKDKNV